MAPHHEDSIVRRITFGYGWLDQVTDGAQPGDIISVSSNTGLGKSYFLAHFALSASASGASVLLMSPPHTRHHILRNYAKISENVWLGDLVRFPSVDDLEEVILDLNPDIIYIDDFHLFKDTHREGCLSSERRILQTLHCLAKTYNKPIVQSIILSNYSRSNEYGLTDIDFDETTIINSSTTVLTISEGPPPFKDTQRTISVVKNRSRRPAWMRTNFLFDPVDLSYIGDSGSLVHTFYLRP